MYLYWIPSHMTVLGNDLADELARQATANLNIDMTAPPRISKLRNANRKAAHRKWEAVWETCTKLSSFHAAVTPRDPDPHIAERHRSLSPLHTQWLTWLRSGFMPLNYIKHTIGKVNSPMCRCGSGSETRDHFMFVCRLWDAPRAIHLQPVLHNNAHDLRHLLENDTCLRAIFDYMDATKRFRRRPC